jgi:hypothetical protein
MCEGEGGGRELFVMRDLRCLCCGMLEWLEMKTGRIRKRKRGRGALTSDWHLWTRLCNATLGRPLCAASAQAPIPLHLLAIGLVLCLAGCLSTLPGGLEMSILAGGTRNPPPPEGGGGGSMGAMI